MRFCYADPPYPGMAYLYRTHPDYAGEVDHAALIARLVEEFPDGWALSTYPHALRLLLPLCPDSTLVMAWVQTNPQPCFQFHQQSWEVVLLNGGRRIKGEYHNDSFVGWKTAPWDRRAGDKIFVGLKPEPFLMWIFRCLGALPGDELVDLFPGSGAVGRAWDKFQRQMTLPLEKEKGRQLALTASGQGEG